MKTYKILPFLIKYTIGLIQPWWLVVILQRAAVKIEYKDDYTIDDYIYAGKLVLYTLGLIFPWWMLLVLKK